MGLTDPDGDAILQEKGIDMLPDILCKRVGLRSATLDGLRTNEASFGTSKGSTRSYIESGQRLRIGA